MLHNPSAAVSGDLERSRAGVKQGKTCGKDLQWKELFRDPSKWRDNRNSKPSPRYPDFTHKVTREPLWIVNRDTPSWVIAELRSRGFTGNPCRAPPFSKFQVDSFVASLRACTRNKDLARGTRIHDDLVQKGLLEKCSDALVVMYAKCGELAKAKELLNMHKSSNIVTWTALIAGYARQGHGQNALDCFEQMQHEGMLPDAVTYACILKACALIGAGDKGEQIHDEITRQGLLQNDIVLGSALVDMYAKCGATSKAQQVLEGLPSRDVVSWSALIAGYAQEGHAEEALDCFEKMQREGILPNAVTYASILKACATIRAVDKGKQFHDEIARQGLLQNDIVLGGALVDMYAKCGAVSNARQVLDGLHSRNVVSWSALIAGYAQEGQVKQARDCFEEMQRDGIVPDVVTCACVLHVCSHRGLVEEGQELFVNMSTKYGVNPSLECYTSMVDLFGRAGHLEKAVRLIQGMPYSDYSIIWHTLLGACRKWQDVIVGRWAFEHAVELDKSDGPAYVLMADIYGTAGMGEKAKDIEVMRIRNRAWKKPGRSLWIDSSNITHAFTVGDTNHPQSKNIDAKLEDIARKMSEQEYSPSLHWVSRDISYAAKAHLLSRHSEKLALACALINTSQGETISITKNMRMCGDCHTATALISKIEMRTIIVTDANFQHRFEDGKCCCNDYL